MDEIRDGGVLFEDPGCECVVCAEVKLIFFFKVFSPTKILLYFYVKLHQCMLYERHEYAI